MIGFPVHPKSPYPWSSVITITIFGLSDFKILSFDFTVAEILALAAWAVSIIKHPEILKANVIRNGRNRCFFEFINEIRVKKGLHGT